MAVEKMSFVNIAGPIEKLDSFVMNNIVPFDIQLVKAFSVLDSVKGLITFTDENPYQETLKKLQDLVDELGIDLNDGGDLFLPSIDINAIEEAVNSYHDQYLKMKNQKNEYEAEKVKKEQIRKQIIPIKRLDVEVDDLFRFEYMKFRFGKMPRDSFSKLQQYVEKLDVIVFKVFEEEEDVFLVYFMPGLVKGEIDSLFASLYFTRIWISDDVVGYPKQALRTIDNEILVINSRLIILQEEIDTFCDAHKEEIINLYQIVNNLEKVFEVRKFAAQSTKAFYLTGWIADSSLSKFMKKMKEEKDVTCIIEEDEVIKKVKPPTKLKNNRFFKPFELLVGMYGIPSYNEIDPTVFVGLTYMLLFGLMFGDVGQGLVIALGGWYFYNKKKVQAAQIAIYLGVCSMLSGLFYGSVFGNEEWIHEHLHFIPVFNPMHNKDTVLVAAVGFGAILITIAMIINIINSIKGKKIGKMLFDRNGMIGLVLYFSMFYIVLSFTLPIETSSLSVALIVISLVIIMLSHPLQNIVERKKHILPEDKGGFFIESVFELIETVLAILSNTISFIRVGAFALNHVGFFMAFHMLSDLVGGAGSPLVMIFGNVLIIGLEGLIVFIQGLRLEYYELFSRFFDGNGTQFTPFKITNKVTSSR